MEKKQADFSSKELQLDKIKNPSTYKSLTTYDQDLDFSIRVYTFQCSVCMLVPEEIFLEKKNKKAGVGGQAGDGYWHRTTKAQGQAHLLFSEQLGLFLTVPVFTKRILL